MPKKKRKFMNGVFIGFAIGVIAWVSSGLILDPLVQNPIATVILQAIAVVISIYVYFRKAERGKGEKKNMSAL